VSIHWAILLLERTTHHTRRTHDDQTRRATNFRSFLFLLFFHNVVDLDLTNPISIV